jgi:hypothetical protein
MTQLLVDMSEPPGTGWTVLKPIEMKSEGGSTPTLLEDGSVLASGGNPRLSLRKAPTVRFVSKR